MNEAKNILFDPRFGKRPARFVGRDDVLRDIRAELNDGDEYEKERVLILSGVKGMGKTSILAEIRRDIDPGRVVLAESFGEGERGAGEGALVYMVDDASRDTPGLCDFLGSFMKRVQDGENIMLILAGLPHAIGDLQKDEGLSRLRKARRYELENVRIEEVAAFYMEAFSHGGPFSAPELPRLLARAAEATAGYPYLIQLIGYYLSKENKTIDDKATDKAIFLSKIELYKNVHAPLVWSLSSKDRMFLWVMAQDEGSSEFGGIAKRMGVTAGYASKYRERLIGAGVVYSSAYGELAFTLPFMKEYIEKEYIERLGGEGGKRRL